VKARLLDTMASSIHGLSDEAFSRSARAAPISDFRNRTSEGTYVKVMKA